MQTMACTASLQLECRAEYDENAGISECGAPKSLGGCHHLSPITKLRHLSLANWDSLVLTIAPERAILQVALSIAGCTKYCSIANRILRSLRVAAYGKPLLAIPVRTLPE